MPRAHRIVLVLLILVACVGCDQVTKLVAADRLDGAGRLSYLGDTFRLEYMRNTGAFLSLGAGLSETLRFWIFLVAVPIVLAVMLVLTVVDHKLSVVQIVAMSLMVAGGLGNLIDRIWLGSVRDFLNVGIGGLRTGVFNVADMAITFGAIVFLLGPWLLRSRASKEGAAES